MNKERPKRRNQNVSLRTMHERQKNTAKPSEQLQLPSTDELLSLIQQLSSKNQELFSINQQLSVTNSDLTEMIQELRSDNQTLRSKVAQQAEKIEKLNESDLELKKAEELQNSLKEKEKKVCHRCGKQTESIHYQKVDLLI